MEKINIEILHSFVATIISLGIISITWLLLLIFYDRNISIDPIIGELFTPGLLLMIVINLLFSYFFYYLNKNLKGLFFFLIFLFFVWAIFFLNFYYSDHKSENRIVDNMEGLSELITVVIIFFVFINLLSNFFTVLFFYFKKKYLRRKL